MKIQPLSDIHLEFAPFNLPATDANVLVLAGDTGSTKVNVVKAVNDMASDTRPVIWVAGNHEFYHGEYPTLMDTFKANPNPNVHFLDNAKLVYNNVRFLGCTLWTDFELMGPPDFDEIQWWLNDYVTIHKPDGQVFSPIDARNAHRTSLNWLKIELARPFNGRTVVITHHSPSAKSITKGHVANYMNPAYHSNLDYLMTPAVNLWIHGHTHASLDYKINDTRIISNARGYPHETTGYNPALVVEV